MMVYKASRNFSTSSYPIYIALAVTTPLTDTRRKILTVTVKYCVPTYLGFTGSVSTQLRCNPGPSLS